MFKAGSWRSAGSTVEKFLTRAAPWLLLLTAAIYYGLYYRSGLNLGGEGGTNAVLALRLMEGQRPIVDTFLGYNLLWFYPLVALFHVAGPDYVLMRIFFFVICTINALLGYAIVRSVTKQSWLALAAGVLLVLVPGMIFRNYMGLIGVLSSLLLLKAYVLPAATPGRQIAWMAGAGAAMTLCFLLRIEPSFLLTVVWLGLAVLFPFGPRSKFAARLRTTTIGTALGLVILVVVHAGVAVHAHQRGFGPELFGKYAVFLELLRNELSREVENLLPASEGSTPPNAWHSDSPFEHRRDAKLELTSNSTPAEASSADSSAAGGATAGSRDARLERTPLLEVWNAPRPRDRYFGLCLYYPVLWCVLFVSLAAAMLFRAIWRGDDTNKQRALVILTTTGCALSLFPQYFWFRPDAPHLSEFMVPFIPAVAASAWVVWQAARAARTRFWLWTAGALVLLSVALVPVYLKAIMPREDAGTIFKMSRPVEFRALNGVNVLLSERDAAAMEGLRDAVLAHSSPGEFVVAYPYAPTVNFMTDRPSYEYNLYVDDATADPNFQRDAADRIARYRPAVIVIDNRPINRTEVSRFKNWAADLTAYIATEYRHVGSFQIGRREVEVYARPDKTPSLEQATPQS